MDTKNTFFQAPTVTDVKHFHSVRNIKEDFVYSILGLQKDQGVLIARRLVPLKSFKGSSREFMKSGPTVNLRRRSLEQMIQGEFSPHMAREEAFERYRQEANGVDAIKSGYAFIPIVWPDGRTRKVSLVNDLEGARILHYSFHYSGNRRKPLIRARSYLDAHQIATQGAKAVLRVPSRRQDHPDHEFRMYSVPIDDNPNKYKIILNIGTEGHSCEKKTHRIQYKNHSGKESPEHLNLCPHEIAGYWSIMNVVKKMSLIPWEMNPFAWPTEVTMRFYDNLLHRTLIKPSPHGHVRTLNDAEKEILLWGLVKIVGHKATFGLLDREVSGGKMKKLQDYQWTSGARYVS